MRDFNSPEYKNWRKAVYSRDNYCCQWPGCTKRQKLNAHHIKKWSDCPGLRFNINNGITLCYQHHKMLQGTEEYYEAVLLKIALENNIKKHE